MYKLHHSPARPPHKDHLGRDVAESDVVEAVLSLPFTFLPEDENDPAFHDPATHLSCLGKLYKEC